LMLVAGLATTWCTLHFGYATTSGGACADRLRTLEPAAVTRHRNRCGRHSESWPAGDHRWWHHLPCPTVPFSGFPRGYGGDLWVAHTGVAGHGRAGHRRCSCGVGGPQRRRAVVVTRGGPGRGAGISENRSATARSHRATSCCRRIHSASTITAASSSRLVAHAVSVAMSLTPFPECCAPGPASEVDRVRR